MEYADDKYINPVNFDQIRYMTTSVSGNEENDKDPYTGFDVNITPINEPNAMLIPPGSELVLEKLTMPTDKETFDINVLINHNNNVNNHPDYSQDQITAEPIIKRLFFVSLVNESAVSEESNQPQTSIFFIMNIPLKRTAAAAAAIKGIKKTPFKFKNPSKKATDTAWISKDLFDIRNLV